MKFARINDAYEFASVLIDVEDLFLDPANPLGLRYVISGLL